MPRVELCDSLRQRTTDKVLSHLPQLNDQAKNLDSAETIKFDENVVTSESIANSATSEAVVKQQREIQSPHCTISAAEAAWQGHLLQNPKGAQVEAINLSSNRSRPT